MSTAVDQSVVSESLRVNELKDKYNSTMRVVSIPTVIHSTTVCVSVLQGAKYFDTVGWVF